MFDFLTSPYRLFLYFYLATLVVGCDGSSLNNPYPASEDGANILYSDFSERPKHLDPARSFASNEIDFTGQIYEPPLQYDYLKRPYQLIPLTATTVPKPIYLDKQGQPLLGSPKVADIAFSVYEIQIQPGILYQPHPAFARDQAGHFLYLALSPQDVDEIDKLSDFKQLGTRELVAEDYVYQIKRLAHPRLNSPILGLMSEYILGLADFAKNLSAADKALRQKKGGHAFLDLREYPLEGVSVVDKYTYRIKIHGKYPQFLYWMAMPFFAPIPFEADQFYNQTGMETKNVVLDWYPVGTGPYMLTKNNPNLQMVMEKNPNFHGERYPEQGEVGDLEAGLLVDSGKPLPFIDKVVYSLEKENIPSWNKFLQGYYDASGVGSDSFDQAITVSNQGNVALTDSMKEKGIKLLTGVATTSYYMGFNMLDPVVGGMSQSARKLRQAISIAINYDEFISIFLNGRGIPAQSPLPPGIFGYQQGEKGVNKVVYNWVNEKLERKPIEAAKKLLAEAGYPHGRDAKTGKPLTIYFDTTSLGPDGKARMDWFRKQFQKIDVQLVVRGTDYNRFQDKILNGTTQIFQLGWNADYPDPENFFFLLYGPNAKVGKNGENSVNYHNAEFDRLFDLMKNMDNGLRRQDIIEKMIAILQEDSPWVWAFHPKQLGLYHAWYKNAKPNLMANNTLKYKRIDAALRSASRMKWNTPVTWPIWMGLLVLVMSVIPAFVIHRRKSRAIGVH